MKRALVTGANRGIGKALVEELTAKDFYVYAGMRNVSDSPFDLPTIRPIEIDVRDDESIRQAANTLMSEGDLSVVINNAGTNLDIVSGHKEHISVLGDVSRQALLAMFDLNTVSPLLVSKYFVPLMTGNDSFIINISSDRASFATQSSQANYGYNASKVALNMFTKCLVLDLPPNVSTFAVHPGWVKTDINPTGVISPGESAQKVISILDNWQSGMNGSFLDNDGTPFPL